MSISGFAATFASAPMGTSPNLSSGIATGGASTLTSATSTVTSATGATSATTGAPDAGIADDARPSDRATSESTANPFAALLAGALTPAATPVARPRFAASPFDAAPETASTEGEEEGVAPESTTGAPSTSTGTVTSAARIVTTNDALTFVTGEAETVLPLARRSLEHARAATPLEAVPHETAAAPTGDLLAAAHARHAALVRTATMDATIASTAATPAPHADARPRAVDDDAPDTLEATDVQRDDRPAPLAGLAGAPAVNPVLLGVLLAASPSPSAPMTNVAPAGAPRVTERTHAGAASRRATDAAASHVGHAAPSADLASTAPLTVPADATATSAAATVASVGAPVAARHTGAPDNDLSSLDPEFRQRLGRVIDRMTGELGHTVEVVETYRDQNRQESLFAQGRSAPGPVVTWTRNSLHTLGRAADIRVDGKSDESAGYRDLRRVAESEGLHTLGARDPGHVEMPRTGGSRYASWVPQHDALASSTQVAGAVMTRIIATGGESAAPSTPTVFTKRDTRVADADVDEPTTPQGVAQVARVATVASVATVARVAVPGAAAASVAAEPVRRRVPNAEERRRAAADAPADALAASSSDAARPAAGGAAHGQDPASVLAAVRADAAHRVSRIMDLQDNAAPTTVSQMLLTLDDAAGGADRVRVDVRGRAVTAALSVAGTERAAALAERSGELRAALAGQGLEPGSVTVTSHAPAIARPDAAPESGSAAERQAQEHAQQQQQQQQSAPGASTQESARAGRERDPRHDAQDESREQSRRESTDPRQRARQGQKEKAAR